MNELVQRLSEGKHPITISLSPERSATNLKRCLDEFGFIHIRFTNTRGGTELGVRLDRNESDWSTADFNNGHGSIRLSGYVQLDYVPVKCIAEVDLGTLDGNGHLEILDGPDSLSKL